jgi:hypothetical protein
MKTAIISIILGSALLVGCGSDEPLTPEQATKVAQKKIAKQLSQECRNKIRMQAKYPSKVDFDFFYETEKHLPNHAYSKDKYPKYPNRFFYSINVELMNGFGAMIPHQAVCVFNYNNDYTSYVFADMEIL